jgi:hypothetical protein
VNLPPNLPLLEPPVVASLTFLVDHDRMYVSVTVDGVDHELGRYDTAAEAGERANRWIGGRGLTWASDSARRLDRAQRLDSKIVTFDLIRAKPTP